MDTATAGFQFALDLHSADPESEFKEFRETPIIMLTAIHSTTPLRFSPDDDFLPVNLFLEKPVLFSELLLEGRVKQYHSAEEFKEKFLFYDRGLLDVVAYLHYVDEKYPEEMQLICNKHRYDTIFILPPWKEIYTSDNERYESFEEANKIHYYLESAYKSYNYNPISIPKGTIEERIAFIIEKLNPY